jgi:hypothetical protein
MFKFKKRSNSKKFKIAKVHKKPSGKKQKLEGRNQQNQRKTKRNIKN